jgi:hypothetical protein
MYYIEIYDYLSKYVSINITYCPWELLGLVQTQINVNIKSYISAVYCLFYTLYIHLGIEIWLSKKEEEF